ncbi:MAG TPA: phosphopentomutase, partial [Firmicutes bacterium]|nr:phosphopentomutase [Bacillota bacterium]
AGRGLTAAVHTGSNREGMEETRRWLYRGEGLVFTNLVDYDMVYGHRNDVRGDAEALEAFDAFLPSLLTGLRDLDLLIITADHGCDPTTPGTDHTREYVPFLGVGPQVRGGVDIGTRTTFADIGATVAQWLEGPPLSTGTGFAKLIRKGERMCGPTM